VHYHRYRRQVGWAHTPAWRPIHRREVVRRVLGAGYPRPHR
jgi:hypothetical protein